MHCALIKRLRSVILLAGLLLLPALPARAAAPAVIIHQLNAGVFGISFFESGRDTPPQGQRVYRTVFDTAHTRFVNWELLLRYERPQAKEYFMIEAQYYDAAGKIVSQQQMRAYLDPNATETRYSQGFGANQTGNWRAGRYRVDVYIYGNRVASASFEITKGGGTQKEAPDERQTVGKSIIPAELKRRIRQLQNRQ